jgi:hypothetical protein
VKIINTIILLAVVGCAKDQPEPQESNTMSQTSEPGPDAEIVSSVDVLTLGAAVPVDEMPKLLQDRLQQRPPTITLKEIRALDPDERSQVLSVLERASAHYRKEGLMQRSAGPNTDRDIANRLAWFLEAARK